MGFEKGKGGRPKGAKNLKTRAKEQRAQVASLVSAAVLAATPAKKAPRKSAKTAANDPVGDAKGAMAELQRLRWLEAETLIAEAATLSASLTGLRVARDMIADEKAPPASDDDLKVWKAEQKDRLALANEALKQAGERITACRLAAKSLQDEAGEQERAEEDEAGAEDFHKVTH